MNRIGFGVVAASLVLTSIGLGTGSAHAQGPIVLYVGPSGTGSTGCAQATPCDLATTIAAAPAGSTVILEPGNYGSADAPLTAQMEAASQVTVEGQPGRPTPTVYGANYGATFVVNSSTLSRVRVVYSAGSIAVDTFSNGVVSHVVSIDTGLGSSVACYVPGSATLVDSVCEATNGGTGIWYFNSGSAGTDQITIRGTTAYSPTGVGFMAEALPSRTGNLTVTNSILKGGTADISLTTTTAGAAINLTLSHDDFSTIHKSQADSAPITVTKLAGNKSAAPTFVNATAGDFREAASSPTIDAGAADTGSDTDLAGNPRTLGSAPDIGAYEFLQRPTISALKLTKRTVHTLSFTVKVNPNGLATAAQIFVLYHGHGGGVGKSIGSARTAQTVHFTVKRLHAHRAFRVHVSAASRAGTTRSHVITATTRHKHRHH